MGVVLLIDLGNTAAKAALFMKGRVSRPNRCSNDQTTTSRLRFLKQVAGKHTVDGAIIGSVAPSMTLGWEKAAAKICGCKPLVASHQLDLGMPLTYSKPATIGVDRLANAAGGFARYGAPLLVIDAGTALKVDVVHPSQGFIGGVIAPGRDLFLDYLSSRAEKLPSLSYRELQTSLGRSTEGAMRLGAQWGFSGMVREIVRNLASTAGKGRLSICVTGGHAQTVVKCLNRAVKYDQDLTLFGLGTIFKLNQNESTAP